MARIDWAKDGTAVRRATMAESRCISLGGAVFRASSYPAIELSTKAHFRGASSPLLLSYVNPHVITSAAESEDVSAGLARCDHVVIDGVGVWLPLALTGNRVDHCAGYEMADRLLTCGAIYGKAVIVGIEPEHHAALKKSVELLCPQLTVVELVDGFASLADTRAVLADHTDADVVLIGAGTPKSEAVLLAASEQCAHALVANVGAGTLKVYAGARTHAPRPIYRAGFEWAFRFWKEPHTRRRYLRGLPHYLRLLARDRPRTIHCEKEHQ